jgi:hypothetical protein
MERTVVASILALSLCAATPARAAEPVTIPREEWEAMKKELSELKTLRQEVGELRKEVVELRTARDDSQAETDQSLDDVEKTVRQIQEHVNSYKPGDTSVLLSGSATMSFLDRHGEDSTFNVIWRPLMLWRFNERLLFEGKLELRMQEATEEIDVFVEAANLSYILNDHIILGAGKFLTPFGLYPDRFYPGKFADDPLPFARAGGLAPHSSVGAFVRGAGELGQNLGNMEWNYAAYVSNGAEARNELARAGQLNFSSTPDTNDNKAVGARVGLLPVTPLEVGYSIWYGGVSPDGFDDDAHALVQGVDVQWVSDIPAIRGVLDARFEYVWSDVDDLSYSQPGPDGFGPLVFGNKRQGGYVELAYRPTRWDWKELRKLELVGRYDWINNPGRAPGQFDETRLTLGVLYWLTPTVSLRAAYQFDDRKNAQDRDALFLQIGVGL